MGKGLRTKLEKTKRKVEDDDQLAPTWSNKRSKVQPESATQQQEAAITASQRRNSANSKRVKARAEMTVINQVSDNNNAIPDDNIERINSSQESQSSQGKSDRSRSRGRSRSKS